MRLIRFEKSTHPAYWPQFYARRPGLAERPFAEQLAAYCEDCSQYAGAFLRELPTLGYEVQEHYTDIEPMQRAWASENGVPWTANWLKSVPLEQAKRFKPDLLYTYDSRNLDGEWLRTAKREIPSLRLVTGFIGSPSFDVETFREYAFLLTCTQEYVELFQSKGIKTYFASHVFDPAVLPRLRPNTQKIREVVFTGAVWRDVRGHTDRERLLEAMVDIPGLEIYSPTGAVTRQADFVDTATRRAAYVAQRALATVGVPEASRRRLPVIGRAATWPAMPMSQINAKLYPQMKPPVFGIEMFQVLAESKVCLNTVAFKEAANMRLFEATGVGSVLLTDYRDNLPDWFDIDREIVTYRSHDECVEKTRWLLDHPQKCEEIAQAGQRRTLRDYTISHRLKLMDDLIRSELA